MKRDTTLSIDYPELGDAEAIKAIQDSWLDSRDGAEGFLVCPESLERLREMIRARNILVARRAGEVLAYVTFYRRSEWERLHPGYTASLDFQPPRLRDAWVGRDYVLIDHIARLRTHAGTAPVSLVLHLRKLLTTWGVDHLLGEISPENRRSAAFFTKTLTAVPIASTVRAEVAWRVYAARADGEAAGEG